MPKLKTATTEPKTAGDMRNTNTMAQLYSFVERFERLTEEVDALTEDRKEVMGEAKGMGFDTKIIRQAIRRRKIPKADRQEGDAMLELYEDILDRAEADATMKSHGEAAPEEDE